MSDEKRDAPKYHVEHAEGSAIGDYAQVHNYFSQKAAQEDAGIAQLRDLFEEVNRRLAALEDADRAMLTPAVEQTAAATAAIQKGEKSPEQETFLEKRLRAIYNMSEDIGEVIITTLANPGAGVALTLQKIAQRARQELKIEEGAG